MPYGFTNNQANDLAQTVDYSIPGANYLGFGNNAGGTGYAAPGGYGFEGGYQFGSSGPGTDDPQGFMQWLSAIGGSAANLAGTAWNRATNGLPLGLGSLIPDANTNHWGIGDSLNLSMNPPANIPYTPSMTAAQMNAQGPAISGSPPGADYGYGENHPMYNPNQGFTPYAGLQPFNNSFGYGFNGQVNQGPVTSGTPYTVNGNDGSVTGSVPIGGPSYGGGSGTPSQGFDPNGTNPLPPFNVNASPFVPPVASFPTLPTQSTPPQITPPGAPQITPPSVTVPSINPPAINPPTLNPGGNDPSAGSGGGGIPGATSTTGDRNAYPEGLAQNYAQGMLAPQQLAQYNAYSGANAAIDARNLGTSLFGAGGPSTIAGQYQALTNGQQDPLLQQQNAIASGLLGQGGDLSASDLRNVQQSTRAAYGARGLDATNGSIVAEAMNTDAARRNRLIQNLGIASGVVGQNQAQRGLVNANNASLFGLASGLTTNSNAYTRNQFDPFNAYGQDLANTNYNAAQARQIQQNNNALALTIAGQNADAAKSAATTSALGSIFGGWLSDSGFGRCYIAREAYGVTNPKWKQFRGWLETMAPAWFVMWYDRNGEKVAEWLRDNPNEKPHVREWMDSMIAEMEAA